MEIFTDRPVLFEWRFADADPFRIVRLIPYKTEVRLPTIGRDDFVSVTISVAEHLRGQMTPSEVDV